MKTAVTNKARNTLGNVAPKSETPPKMRLGNLTDQVIAVSSLRLGKLHISA